jgi:hypothetical protein
MTGSPLFTANPALGTARLREKALALIRWQPVQWHAIVSSGGRLISNRTWPQRHPPAQGNFHSLMGTPPWAYRVLDATKRSTSALRNRSQRGGHCFQHAGAEVRE